MKIKQGKEQEYQSYKEINSKDGYSKGVVEHTEKWANLMEEQLAQGKKLKDIYKECSSQADTDGITGFMYGCSVKALAYFWKYGDVVRKLHNKEYGVSEDKKGTVNPAIINIG